MTAQTPKILREVAAERDRQDVKWGEQNHPNFISLIQSEELTLDQAKAMLLEYYGVPRAATTQDECDTADQEERLTWGHIAVEEFAEAFEECDSPEKLRKELIQCAAVLVAWVECIDRGKVGREKLELEARQLQEGDLFSYVGSFTVYKAESEIEKRTNEELNTWVHLSISRDAQPIGRCKLRFKEPVTVWRAVES